MNYAINKLAKVFELEGMTMDGNRSDTYHFVKHRYRDEIVVPIAAISNNIDFIIYDAKKHVQTSDDVECEVESWSEAHICDLEDKIKELYGLDAWAFVKTWHKHEPCMTSMSFITMKLKRV